MLKFKELTSKARREVLEPKKLIESNIKMHRCLNDELVLPYNWIIEKYGENSSVKFEVILFLCKTWADKFENNQSNFCVHDFKHLGWINIAKNNV